MRYRSPKSALHKPVVPFFPREAQAELIICQWLFWQQLSTFKRLLNRMALHAYLETVKSKGMSELVPVANPPRRPKQCLPRELNGSDDKRRKLPQKERIAGLKDFHHLQEPTLSHIAFNQM